jgi:hypothetical protein
MHEANGPILHKPVSAEVLLMTIQATLVDGQHRSSRQARDSFAQKPLGFLGFYRQSPARGRVIVARVIVPFSDP